MKGVLIRSGSIVATALTASLLIGTAASAAPAPAPAQASAQASTDRSEMQRLLGASSPEVDTALRLQSQVRQLVEREPALAHSVTLPAREQKTATRAAIGDGVWSPSHDESIAIIPLCRPLDLVDWLIKNFSDHGRDIAKFLGDNFNTIVHVVTVSLNPFELIEKLFKDVLQIVVYAVNDTKFHVPATVGDILSFCKSARS
ncbi:hypothetical protein [Sciscionella sediminilitoris]|uniref:hypothetical protein n=1 Tax=Sciscionella sediminilitoris TaxID=1445613 RepID=UPI0004DFB06C|nr:hypothetical protein [Sciscionella sp. SE31]